MANPYDFLGDSRTSFMKSSWKVYTDLSGSLQYVGKTDNEKVIRTDAEFTEWSDNTSGIQTLYVKDYDSFNFSLDFSFMQVADPNALAIAFNLEWDNSDANWEYLFGGSEPGNLSEAKWVFVGRTRTGLSIETHVRKGVITPNGEWPSGAPGDYARLPVTCSALQDTSITNTSRDLFYIRIQKAASGS
jgi:hypothetical protein